MVILLLAQKIIPKNYTYIHLYYHWAAFGKCFFSEKGGGEKWSKTETKIIASLFLAVSDGHILRLCGLLCEAKVQTESDARAIFGRRRKKNQWTSVEQGFVNSPCDPLRICEGNIFSYSQTFGKKDFLIIILYNQCLYILLENLPYLQCLPDSGIHPTPSKDGYVNWVALNSYARVSGPKNE